MIDNIINNIEIGIEEPSIAKFTKLEIDSLNAPGQAFKSDGDIHISGTFLNERRELKSDNPYKLNMLSTLEINALDKIFITTDQDLKLSTLQNLELKSKPLLNINTNKLDINSKSEYLNESDSGGMNDGSVIMRGGLSVNKNLNVGGNLTILNDNENCLRLDGGIL